MLVDTWTEWTHYFSAFLMIAQELPGLPEKNPEKKIKIVSGVQNVGPYYYPLKYIKYRTHICLLIFLHFIERRIEVKYLKVTGHNIHPRIELELMVMWTKLICDLYGLLWASARTNRPRMQWDIHCIELVLRGFVWIALMASFIVLDDESQPFNCFRSIFNVYSLQNNTEIHNPYHVSYCVMENLNPR